jgi:hypothetical protein
MSSWEALRGRKVAHTSLGRGTIVAVDLDADPREPRVLIQFQEDDKRQRRFLLRALKDEQYFDKVSLPEGCLIVESSTETTQQGPGRENEDVRSRNRREAIRSFCRDRKIQVLTHFTRVANLRSIFEAGLLSRAVLEDWPESQRPTFNDSKRLDRRKNAVCLSISFPNYSMFFKYRKRTSVEWAVLLVRPSLLWELDCGFCSANAASGEMRRTSLSELKEAGALRRMFDDCAGTAREDLGVPDSFPTDPQAEILVFDVVPPHYIRTACFHNTTAVEQAKRVIEERKWPKLRVDQRYFRARADYASWGSSQESSGAPSDEQEIVF